MSAAIVWFTLAISVAAGRTGICDLVVDGDVWTIADSPVLVSCKLTIANLTIEEGVQVIMTGDHRIEIAGVIRVLGTQQSPVVFKPSDGNATGWQGLRFVDTIPGSMIRWARIEGANRSAMHIIRSTPLISSVTFEDNSGSSGAALLVEDSAIRVSNCLFVGNRAEHLGGAIFFFGPTGEEGFEFVDCVFLRNRVGTMSTRHETRGGAIAVAGNGSIVGCTFIENESRAFTTNVRGGGFTMGGAIYSANFYTEVEASTFLRNACRMGTDGQTQSRSRACGSAIHVASGRLTLSNSLVAQNVLSTSRHPDHRGGGLYAAAGTVSIVNSTFADNDHHAVYRDDGTVEIVNSILFFNNDSGSQIAGSVSVTYSDVQNGFSGQGNISLNPIFNNEYVITAQSPAVDAGTNSPVVADMDLSGSPRTCGEAVDMGAYEYCDRDSTQQFLRGDCNSDGVVSGTADAIHMLVWRFLGDATLECKSACDVDTDGTAASISDAVKVLTHNFIGGVEIPAPFPGCAESTTPSDVVLGCEASSCSPE